MIKWGGEFLGCYFIIFFVKLFSATISKIAILLTTNKKDFIMSFETTEEKRKYENMSATDLTGQAGKQVILTAIEKISLKGLPDNQQKALKKTKFLALYTNPEINSYVSNLAIKIDNYTGSHGETAAQFILDEVDDFKSKYKDTLKNITSVFTK